MLPQSLAFRKSTEDHMFDLRIFTYTLTVKSWTALTHNFALLLSYVRWHYQQSMTIIVFVQVSAL